MFSLLKEGSRIVKWLIGLSSDGSSLQRNSIRPPNLVIARFCVTTLISIVVLVAGLSILMDSDYSIETQKLAAGFIGMVVGYWLR